MGTEVSREEIQRLAYQLWIERGRPEGSPQDDWERAERLLEFAHAESTAEQQINAFIAEETRMEPQSEIEVISGAAYVRPKQRNGGSRRSARA